MKGLSSEKIAFCKGLLSGSTKMPENDKAALARKAAQYALDADTASKFLEAVEFHRVASSAYKQAIKVNDKARVSKQERIEVQARIAYELQGEKALQSAANREKSAAVRAAAIRAIANA